MVIYTAQLNHPLPPNVVGVNVTVMSGDTRFSPTWELLNDYKSGRIDAQGYTERFKDLMLISYRDNYERWLELLTGGSIAIQCYCTAGKFCHRHLLVEYLAIVAEHEGLMIEWGGELTIT